MVALSRKLRIALLRLLANFASNPSTPARGLGVIKSVLEFYADVAGHDGEEYSPEQLLI
jgi:hypothetical protein